METIIVVGGGAGGLELATRLGDKLGKSGRARIVLVDRSPAHFWKPLLHTVASGKRDPALCEIEYSAQASEHGFTFEQGELLAIERDERHIVLAPCTSADGLEVQPRRALAYTRLVLAFGSVTNFFNVPGACEHVLTLDNVGQAEAFRARFVALCIAASAHNARGARPYRRVDITIVGGGATGVELAAELSFSARALARYKVHTLDPVRDVRISILERGKHLLPHLPAALSTRAESYLRGLGVQVCTGVGVASVAADGVRDVDGVLHGADMMLWAAGVEGPQICATLGLTLNQNRQIKVLPSLQTLDDPAIFAIGDCASFVCPVKGVAPPRAQVAHQQALFLADALAQDARGPLPMFSYRDYGSLVSLGPVAGVGILVGALTGRKLSVSGAMAQTLYALMYQKHLLALHGFVRAAAQALASWLRAKTSPPVKLH